MIENIDNYSFWINKPVNKENHFYKIKNKQIISNKDLYTSSKKESEILKKHLDIHYYVLEKNKKTLNFLQKFLENNYNNTTDNFINIYNISLLHYSLPKNSVILVAYKKRKIDDIYIEVPIGLITGKRVRIFIENKTKNMIEVNYLCVTEEYRGNHLSSFLISKIIQLGIEKYKDTYTGLYTTTNPIAKIKQYTKKKFYHRPINLNLLISLTIIHDIKKNDKIYNMLSDFYLDEEFIKDKQLTLFSRKKYNDEQYKELINIIYNKLKQYNKTNYKIYKKFNKNEIDKLLKNTSFTNFIIFDKLSGTVTDFLSFYKIDCLNQNNKNHKIEYYKDGNLYCYFFQHNSSEYLMPLLNYIMYYIKINEIYDIVTIIDNFSYTSEIYKKYKYLPGDISMNYYMYNLQIQNMEKNFVNLVTI